MALQPVCLPGRPRTRVAPRSLTVTADRNSDGVFARLARIGLHFLSPARRLAPAFPGRSPWPAAVCGPQSQRTALPHGSTGSCPLQDALSPGPLRVSLRLVSTHDIRDSRVPASLAACAAQNAVEGSTAPVPTAVGSQNSNLRTRLARMRLRLRLRLRDCLLTGSALGSLRFRRLPAPSFPLPSLCSSRTLVTIIDATA